MQKIAKDFRGRIISSYPTTFPSKTTARLSADKKSLVLWNSEVILKEYIHNLYPHLNPHRRNIIAVKLRGNYEGNDLAVLLDIGTVGGNNYITPETANVLKLHQMCSTDCNCQTINIFRAFGTYEPNNECVNFNITLYHTNDPNKVVDLTSTARVVEGLTTPVII